MSFTLRPAARENVPLLIGLAGGTGSGKTYSAMLLAKGLAGAERFAVIDTESGRAKAYADTFAFDQGELTAPFTPDSYAEAILAVDAAKYPVIVVDSCSHEYAGDGGVLDMQEDELDRMAGQDFAKREACKMASWVKPKMAHKAFMSKLLQIRSHLILCFRAEPKTEMVKEQGRWAVRPKQGLTGLNGWFPICEKNMPYELTAYFLLRAEQPGYPLPIKLQEQHQRFFPLDMPITAEAGRLLGEWAKGKTGPKAYAEVTPPPKPSIAEESGAITLQQGAQLARRFRESLREELRDRFEILLVDFLRVQGFEGGNMMMIPQMLFAEIGKKAVAHAKSL